MACLYLLVQQLGLYLILKSLLVSTFHCMLLTFEQSFVSILTLHGSTDSQRQFKLSVSGEILRAFCQH